MTWPAGRHPTGPPGDGLAAVATAAPGTYPVPAGRGQWRLILLERDFTGTTQWGQLALAEIAGATGRRLEQNWNQSATLTFSVDGHSAAASAVAELTTDVLALRWDDQQGRDIPVFRGVVAQSEDQLSEQQHTVTFTCHDYFAMLARRLFTANFSAVNQDQDNVIISMVYVATSASASSGTTLVPGSYLPLQVQRVNPDGSRRTGLSGQLRTRAYYPSTQIGQSISDLAAVINGFDFDVVPTGGQVGGLTYNIDSLRIFYPYQGITRSQPALVYGSSISSLTRSVNSADYANYWRVIGNNGSSDPAAAQLYAEAWNSDANNVGQNPIGLWMGADDAADVTIQSTLNDKAAGDLALNGLIVPTYTLSLRPGVYSWGAFNMGDVLPLVVRAGRLNVNTTIRVLGIAYSIGDDGQEDVELTVGRPAVTLPYLLSQPLQDIGALTRR